MIILSTYGFSASALAWLDGVVRSWFDRQSELSICTTSIDGFALRPRTELLAKSGQCNVLKALFTHLFEEDTQDLVILFNTGVAKVAMSFTADRQRSPRPQELRRRLIAAIVFVSHPPPATQNMRHFFKLPARLIDLWRT
jgi:hypothetical protein